MGKGFPGVCILALFALASSAQAVPTAVSVTSVRFEQRRLPGQSYPWLEAAVNVRPSGMTAPENIQIKLWILYQSPSGKFVYEGRAQLYSLNDPAIVRFYLPPDVLRARRLAQTPTGYYLELSSSAGAEAFDNSHASPSLFSGTARAELKGVPTQALLPHYNTPFYSLPETFRDLPSYVVP